MKIGIDIDSVPDKAESAKARLVMRNGKRVRLGRGITVESGAASNVMPRRMVRNKQKIRPLLLQFEEFTTLPPTMAGSPMKVRWIPTSSPRRATATLW